jgi:CubicO group peptidase (beta-lactamase class C family)
MKSSILAFALVFMGGAAAAAENPHIARIEQDQESVVQVRGRPVVHTTLAEAMAAHHTPAISVAVVDHGRIVWAKAYGLADVARGTTATVHTTFQAGSVSKPVAASAAMQLIQEGKLSLDRPANDQLTSWRIPDNPFTKDKPVTLRHLLTHTGGTTVHGFPGYAAGAPVPTVVQVLEGKPPANTQPVVVERAPGERWNYSGGGITIAQLMMTDVSHESFPALTQRRIFAPLGMADSSYEQPPGPARAPAAATGYDPAGKAVEGRYHTYPEMAAAGLWTTPTDLAKWAIALQEAYDGRSTRLMSEASAKAMLTPGLGNWGLGVEVQGAGDTLRFLHGGDDVGFKTELVGYLTGGRAIVVMGNGDDADVVMRQLMQAIARDYGWRGLEPKVIDAVTLSEAQRREMAGSYNHRQVVVTVEGSTLIGAVGDRHFELIPVGHDHLIAIVDGAQPLSMTRGPDGKVNGLEAGVILKRDPAP